jgi:hypothetical protein
MKHHWRKMLEADSEGRPHLSGAKCEWCSIAKGLDDMPADIRTMFHSREADNLRVAWSWLHTEFPGECPGQAAQPLLGYRVVCSDRLEVLVAEVGNLMTEGWVPSGSLVLQPALVTAASGMRYFQPMLRQ